MDRTCKSLQTHEQRRRGSVEVLVANAADTAGLCGAKVLPSAIADNFFERNPIARAAPGGNEYLGIFLAHGCGTGLNARPSDKLAPGNIDQLCHPWL